MPYTKASLFPLTVDECAPTANATYANATATATSLDVGLIRRQYHVGVRRMTSPDWQWAGAETVDLLEVVSELGNDILGYIYEHQWDETELMQLVGGMDGYQVRVEHQAPEWEAVVVLAMECLIEAAARGAREADLVMAAESGDLWYQIKICRLDDAPLKYADEVKQ